ncbi:unnamed protein product [Ixodes persulcatus]
MASLGDSGHRALGWVARQIQRPNRRFSHHAPFHSPTAADATIRQGRSGNNKTMWSRHSESGVILLSCLCAIGFQLRSDSTRNGIWMVLNFGKRLLRKTSNTVRRLVSRY